MSSINPPSTSNQVIEVQGTERWEVYHRLQELDIPCECTLNQPLQIELNTYSQGILLWSVVKRIKAPRQELINWLDRCWVLDIDDTN
ncbi:conserved hypothetical protein [Gloeothece citriformis PCC 7424]|uniref:Uncharacterized protein n=1 Tax=Gloeothece citriformis (strain PCC 7424) TaxID=65393 RepID=B7KI86_GLOC7|nr:Asr1405/Asl0597 family protein [Gloeothece citriformis]ACK73573.1 conserved hypothetical protein [Gloeothece citriformis PCC 7424]